MSIQTSKMRTNEESKIIEATQANFVNDASYAIKICRKFLKVLGVWIPIDASVFSSYTVFGKFSVIFCYYGICIRGIPSGLYIILDERRPTEMLKLFVRWIFVFMATMKYIFLRFNRKNIQKCMKHIELDWVKIDCMTNRNTMMEQARFGHLITKICVTFTYSSYIFLTMMPLAQRTISADNAHNGNVTETLTVKRFTVPSHFGFALFIKSPIYEIVYSSQVIGSFMMHSIALACYSLAVVIVMHACGQLKILMGKLNELVDGGETMVMYDSVDSRMADIIKHHVRTLRFIISAEKMLRGICLVEIVGYTFEMCCLGYFSLLEFRAETKNPIATCAWTTILFTFMFNVLSFCYIGELLTQEYVRLGEVAYMIDWYRLPGKKSLALGLMIAMTQCPVTLTAGGAFQLSMRCFATVMRTTLGYVNMLRTVMD